ncbi:hypothetical protein SDC9_71191 [bioreactor metagenome]|uniref:4Fe-4S ferredoxin-type domain-containing protein n=1 Tax=bioreactor metagenome TaxID=1076179 RepID=A0A644Y972_9ZZZZ
MKAVIRTSTCIGCGHCMDACPEYFLLTESTALYIGPPVLSAQGIAEIRGAIALCPSRSIRLMA